MKRIAALLLALLLTLLLAVPSLAGADATEKRGLVEFVELFTLRAAKYQNDNNIDVGLLPNNLIPPFMHDGLLCFSSVGYSVFVNTDDFTVQSSLIPFIISYGNEMQLRRTLIRAAIAVSVLEYDYESNRSLEQSGSSAVDEGKRIIQSANSTTDTMLDAMRKTGQPVIVYSGNYDYWIKYEDMSGKEGRKDGDYWIYLYAEAHE